MLRFPHWRNDVTVGRPSSPASSCSTYFSSIRSWSRSKSKSAESDAGPYVYRSSNLATNGARMAWNRCSHPSQSSDFASIIRRFVSSATCASGTGVTRYFSRSRASRLPTRCSTADSVSKTSFFWGNWEAVTARLLPRRFCSDASDEEFVVNKAVEEVVPFLG